MIIKLAARSIYELGKRTNQEDSIYPPYSPVPTAGSLYILCDGMGGHAAGEVASGTVCETMSRYVAAHPREDGLFDQTDFYAALDAAYDALDAKDTGDEKKMGTTLTFVKFHAGGCFIAHIGDSRIYHIRPSEHRILHVTSDHSLVNDLIKLGEMTPEEARTSRQKNVITRAVQPNQESRTKADCRNIDDLQPGDYFFLCSDGMLERTEDREILNILSLERSDDEKIEILKGATRENKDNHSAHLIRILEVRDGRALESSFQAAKVTPAGNGPESKAAPELLPVPVPEQKEETRPARPWRWLLPLILVAALAICIPWMLRHRKSQTPDPEPSSTEASITGKRHKEHDETARNKRRMGLLKVISTPAGATIWLDGNNTEEKTPFVFQEVEAGDHTIQLFLEGYRDMTWTIRVVPKHENATSVTLEPVPVPPGDVLDKVPAEEVGGGSALPDDLPDVI